MDAFSIVENELESLQTKPHRLLEIGAGSGDFLKKLTKQYQAEGVGIDPFAHEAPQDNPRLYKKAAEEVGSLRRWFDVVYSIRAFHHFTEPGRCLKALRSVLAWGGRCLLVDWHKGASTGYPEYYYSMEEASEMMEKAGLHILKRKRFGDLFLISATLNSWRVAVAADSTGGIIFQKMFGQAPQFQVYSLSLSSKPQLVETRRNPYEKTLQHEKTFDVYKLVNDCPILVSSRIGKRGISRLEKMGVTLIFKQGPISSFLTSDFLKNPFVL